MSILLSVLLTNSLILGIVSFYVRHSNNFSERFVSFFGFVIVLQCVLMVAYAIGWIWS